MRTVYVAAAGEDNKRSIEVSVPTGADDGDKIIIEGEGNRSEFRGGRRGNLIVRLKVKGHPKLQRVGSTISSSIHIPWAYLPARKGFKLAVLTVDGPIEVQLPCNLDDDMNIVIENKGVPYPHRRGIHHVHIRRGRPHERFLFQTAEVVITAAAVCMVTVATNHIRHKGDSNQLAVEGKNEEHGTHTE